MSHDGCRSSRLFRLLILQQSPVTSEILEALRERKPPPRHSIQYTFKLNSICIVQNCILANCSLFHCDLTRLTLDPY